MSDDKVVSLRGAFIPALSTGDKDVTEILRDLLVKAEAGEIIGISAAYVHRDLTAAWSRGGSLGSFSIIGAVECMKYELVKIATDDE